MFKAKVLLPLDFSRDKELVQYISQVCHVQASVLSASRPQLEIFADDQESLHFSQNLALSFVGPEFETVLRLSPAILTAFKIVEIQRYFARRHRMIVIAENNGSLYMCGPASRVEAASEVLADVGLYSISLDSPVETGDFKKLCLSYDISSKIIAKKAKVEEINFLFYFLPLVESKMDCLDKKSLLVQGSFDAYRKLNDCEAPKPVSNGTPNQQVSAISTHGKRNSSKRRRHRGKKCFGSPMLNGNIKDRRRRVVVIDGANVAHSESTTRRYNLGNLRIAYNYFVKRGFTEVKIVLPEATNECLQYFSDEELTKHFIFTPIRRLIPGEKPQRADDDSIIIQMAMGLDGVVISNDRYRDFLARNPNAKDFLMNQVIPYNLSEGIFAISDYPLGTNHKSLDELLTFPP
nr:ribonuclease ZC3H12C [Hymenolepis microstoma]